MERGSVTILVSGYSTFRIDVPASGHIGSPAEADYPSGRTRVMANHTIDYTMVINTDIVSSPGDSSDR